ncbi:hypothetical protein HKBW3S42_00237 [Candidatus Hakubella thermalkaliphila]|nr:phosphohydrolase [Candidatus Hakubella thermalkaliphila]MBT9171562.1 hypothetical protein [Actinomycetota bacterium]GFP31931.1 hypothetical protein HKBW3S42_00237 [Candidatus Hakubella thermalkaliphila]
MTVPKHCPGSSTFKEPVPEYMSCPKCGTEVEIWSDEVCLPCPNCKTIVFKDRSPSCLDWCAFARECFGPEVYERLKGSTSKESKS